MRYFPLFLARRFLQSSGQEKNISTMIKVCFTGIMIGTFSLTLVVAIMNGFESATHEKLQGIHSDIIIKAHGAPIAYDKVRTVLLSEFKQTIKAVSPYALGHAMIQAPDSHDISQLVTIIGMDPATDSQVSSLANTIITPKNSSNTLEDLLAHDNLLIGQILAQELDIHPGGPVTLLFTPDQESADGTITLDTIKAHVGQVFKTGIDEFDTHAVFCSLQFFEKIFGDAEISSLGIKLQPGVTPHRVIPVLKERLGLDVFSWKDMYPALVAALLLEKYAMFFILGLITLVASMNIISLLFMYITQKRSDIAILKAMGMSDSAITHIFVILGMTLALSATIIGILGAAVVSWLLETYPFISLPDVYYVSHLPAKISWPIVAAVLAVVTLLSFIATWLPARQIRRMSITSILKFEA